MGEATRMINRSPIRPGPREASWTKSVSCFRGCTSRSYTHYSFLKKVMIGNRPEIDITDMDVGGKKKYEAPDHLKYPSPPCGQLLLLPGGGR